MVYKGSDVVILSGGQPLAASKSCSIDVDVDLIKVSSASDGQWEHSIAGRKSWSMTTNHLLVGRPYVDGIIEGQAFGFQGPQHTASSLIKAGGMTITTQERGLGLVFLSNTPPYTPVQANNKWINVFDTYDETQEAGDAAGLQLLQMIDDTNNKKFAIVSFDAYGLTSTVKTNLASMLNVDLSGVPVERDRGALVIIGGKDISKGMVAYTAPTSATYGNFGGSAKTKLCLNNSQVITETLLKSFEAQVGTTHTITVQVEGFPYDTITCTAICKSAKVQATKSNLLTGSFSWVGSGPLT